MTRKLSIRMRQFSSEYLLLLALVGDKRLRKLVDTELDRRANAVCIDKPYPQLPPSVNVT